MRVLLVLLLIYRIPWTYIRNVFIEVNVIQILVMQGPFSVVLVLLKFFRNTSFL